jgi:glycosyltransferase involved in cell wall biosynthesis
VKLSVVLPTHNPHAGRLRRTLAGLRAQTLSSGDWETVLVDNASTPAVDAQVLGDLAPPNLRLVAEPQLGLTHARHRGLSEARGEFLVLVDDDNVLAPDYLARVLAIFASHPHLGVLGGRSLPEFECPPPPWVREFDGLLACRDPGNEPKIAPSFRTSPGHPHEYPACAPIGAGMALRREAVQSWLTSDSSALVTDRRGAELTSGGDNDIVLTIAVKWDVGYFPELALTHLIPAGRLSREYLARLNRGIARSWVQVLHKHGVNPWPPIPAWTVPLRQIKAWFTYRVWAGPAAYVRWQGACGHFAGLASLPRS